VSYLALDCYVTSRRDINPERKVWLESLPGIIKPQRKRKRECEIGKFSFPDATMDSVICHVAETQVSFSS
jgi:hypothetical protein